MEALTDKEKEAWLAVFKLNPRRYPSGSIYRIIEVVGRKRGFLILIEELYGRFACALYHLETQQMHPTYIAWGNEIPWDVLNNKVDFYISYYLKEINWIRKS